MCRRRGVSLLELLVALAVLTLVAALAIPRFSRAARGPDVEVVLRDQLQVLRIAIECYYQDHGVYPGQTSDGQNPAGSAAAVVNQLTMCSDDGGICGPVRDTRFRWGPYLRDGVPPCAVHDGPAAAEITVVDGPMLSGFTPATPAGWLYNIATGQIAAHSAATDETGRGYASY